MLLPPSPLPHYTSEKTYLQNAKCKMQRRESRASSSFEHYAERAQHFGGGQKCKSPLPKKNEKKFFFIFSTHNYFLFPLAPYLLYRAYG